MNDSLETGVMESVPCVTSTVRKAVILAAGRGSRLHSITEEVPKCMVEIAGEKLIDGALRKLAGIGIREVVIIVGYKSEVVRAHLDKQQLSVDVSFVDAPDFATTNNIRSLWDARDHLDEDLLLIEGDIAFDPNVIETLLNVPSNAAAVSTYHNSLSGTVVRHDEAGCITEFVMGREQHGQFDYSDTFKTVNIYLLKGEFLQKELVPRLDRAIADNKVQEYYESVIADCIGDGSLSDMVAVDVSDMRWSEIDDGRDLDVAEFQFMDRDAQFDRVQKLHGAYWRYGFVDHSYLYNMYFPPREMLDVFNQHLMDIVTNYPAAQHELASLVSSWTKTNPGYLAVANGAAELIKILGNSFFGRLTIPTPSFNEYEEVISPQKLNRFHLDPETFELDVDAFADSAIRANSDFAVVVTPNNPTALSVPKADIRRLAGKLAENGCRLLVDESFIEFSDTGIEGSLEGLVEEHLNLVVLKSMSKVFGVAGIRLGYLLSADEQFITDIRANLPIWNINGVAEEFLRIVGRYRQQFEESCQLTRQSCRDLYSRLNALPGVEAIRSDANFILCRLTCDNMDAPTFARRLYVEHNILIKDCAAKSMRDADRYLRIASRTPKENEQLLSALQTLLNQENDNVRSAKP